MIDPGAPAASGPGETSIRNPLPGPPGEPTEPDGPVQEPLSDRFAPPVPSTRTAPAQPTPGPSTASTAPEPRAAGEPAEEPSTGSSVPALPEGPIVAALVADLFFSVPIAGAIRAAGARPLIVESADALAAAIERWPALVIIDLSAGSGASAAWQPVVRRARLLPQTRAIPVVAFGSHVARDTMAAARAAGCDHVWARSRFVAELPTLLQQVLRPPLPDITGCDEPPPPGLRRGVEQFNAGEYWECHETLETLWRAEPRPIRDLYQGILQVGVAFHHLQQRNYPGALKLLRRGLPRLVRLPDTCQGVPVAALRAAAEDIHTQLVALGPDRIAEFDLSILPHIELLSAPESYGAGAETGEQPSTPSTASTVLKPAKDA